MTSTIFDKILSGDVPCHKVYEDDHTLAFLDIAPKAPGHTLVIHKHDRCANLSDMANESSSQLIHSAQRVINQLTEKLDAHGVNVLVAQGSAAGQEVMHVHIHLIPRTEDDNLKIHGVRGPRAQDTDLEDVATQLTS